MLTWQQVGIDIPSGVAGPEVYTTCPKCSHERRKRQAKCLSANLDENVWTCHHCGWSGSLKTGRQDRLDPGWRKPKWVRPEPSPAGNISAQAVTWLETRGITRGILEQNKIATMRIYMPQLEDHVEAIVFPYFRDGELINRKYRGGGKCFRMDTGAERVFYNLDAIDPSCLVVCEGEIDCLSLQVAGMSSCVSVPDGAPAADSKDYSSKFAFLEADAERLDPIEKIVLAVDNDAPGRKLEDELARRFGRERCYRVEWPPGCKDANDVLVKHSSTVLREVIDAAEPYPIEGVFTSIGEKTNVFALYDDGFQRGLSTGWSNLDRHFTVRPGEMTIVLGVPGSGKSNFVDALSVKLAEKHGWIVAVFSPENQPIHEHMARIIEKYVGAPFDDGPTQRMSRDELEFGLQWVGEHFFWMLPNDETSWSIGWVLERTRELVKRHGVRCLVVDPWNELEHNRKPGESETEYIGSALRNIRQFARHNGVHVFVVVHPAKMYRDKEGKYPIPNLYDASSSAHWRNKADNGLCIWRDFADGGASRTVDIHIQKIRFRQIGKLGKVSLEYQPATARYCEPPVDNSQLFDGGRERAYVD